MQYYAVLRTPKLLEFQSTKPEDAKEYCLFSGDESYFETVPPWHDYRKTVRKVCFCDEISPLYTDNWFLDFELLEEFDKTNLNLSRTISTIGMFNRCHNLETIDLSGLNTSNIEDLSYMFANCTALKKIDFSGWNTSKVKSFCEMFAGCESIRRIDLTSFTAESAENILRMFYNCLSLKEIIWPNFKSSKKIEATGLLYHCSSLESLDISNIIIKESTCIYSKNDLKVLNFIRVNRENYPLIKTWFQ